MEEVDKSIVINSECFLSFVVLCICIDPSNGIINFNLKRMLQHALIGFYWTCFFCSQSHVTKTAINTLVKSRKLREEQTRLLHVFTIVDKLFTSSHASVMEWFNPFLAGHV